MLRVLSIALVALGVIILFVLVSVPTQAQPAIPAGEWAGGKECHFYTYAKDSYCIPVSASGSLATTEPTATPTPEPTATPLPTNTPGPTTTPEPVAYSGPSVLEGIKLWYRWDKSVAMPDDPEDAEALEEELIAEAKAVPERNRLTDECRQRASIFEYPYLGAGYLARPLFLYRDRDGTAVVQFHYGYCWRPPLDPS